MQLTDEQVTAIIAWAEKTPQVQAVMLFGSRCKGTARSDSDVDIAITIPRGTRNGTPSKDYGGRVNEARCRWISAQQRKIIVVGPLPPRGRGTGLRRKDDGGGDNRQAAQGCRYQPKKYRSRSSP